MTPPATQQWTPSTINWWKSGEGPGHACGGEAAPGPAPAPGPLAAAARGSCPPSECVPRCPAPPAAASTWRRRPTARGGSPWPGGAGGRAGCSAPAGGPCRGRSAGASHASASAEPHAVRPLRPCHRDWSQRPDTIFSPAQQWIANLTRADVREKGSGTEVMQCVGQGWWWRRGARAQGVGCREGGLAASQRAGGMRRRHAPTPTMAACAACAACCRSYYLTGGLRYYNQARACPPCPPSAIAPSAAAAPGPAALLPALAQASMPQSPISAATLLTPAGTPPRPPPLPQLAQPYGMRQFPK